MEGDYPEDLLVDTSTDLKRLGVESEQPYRAAVEERMGSRYAGPNADETLTKHRAAGGTIKTAPRSFGTKGYGRGSLARSLKALSEGVGSSGGWLGSWPSSGVSSVGGDALDRHSCAVASCAAFLIGSEAGKPS
jgi:hypothetical protein